VDDVPHVRVLGRHSSQSAWLVTAPLALLAVPLAVAAQIGQPLPVSDWLFALLFLALFLVADAGVLRFEIRRHALRVSGVEVPLLLALFYLAPLPVICARVFAIMVRRAYRPQAPVRLCFNLAAQAVATAVATLVVRAYGPLEGVGPRIWLVLTGAVLADATVTLAAGITVLTLVQGRLSKGDIVRTAVGGHSVAAINIMLGLLALLALRQTPWAVLLLVALTAVFFVGYRSYEQVVRHHQTLAALYELTREIRDTRHEGVLTDTLLRRVRELMRAEYATLWLPAQGRHPEVLLTARTENHGLLDVAPTPQTLRKRAVQEDRTIAVGERLGNLELLPELLATGVNDAICVPLKSGSAVIGCLEVAARLAGLARFQPGDVELMEAVAAQAAVAVENSRLVERLRFDAYHDTLTGLPNRRRMLASLEEAVKVRAPGDVVAVLLFDVDGLRDVNESLGHSAGDKLVTEVAGRLREHAPPGALVGRVGGDEFAVTLRTTSAETALELAASLRGKVQGQLEFGTLTLGVDTAAGVVVHPDHGADAAILLQRADVATHAAKNMPASVQLFNAALESRSARRLGLAGELRRALDGDELEVYFQPKVALRDRRLVGVECLARWEHPAHGSVSPEDFVAVAEHTGQLSRLTDAVLREGLRRCRQWADAGRLLSIAVNLSPRTLFDPGFPLRVRDLLDEYGVAPDRLTLEITEDGVVGETDRPMPALRRLNEIGVRLAVDDFGTGYSSLSYLRRLPVHEVKVDQAFVQGMATDPGDLAIVRAVVDLSRHFGLTVVAEGVESELTLNLLEEIGCDIGQGFLFSRPLPYERLEAWFGAQTEAEPTPLGEVRRLRAVT
jgi:diguanylate cyclase (GGDEF)-like protein